MDQESRRVGLKWKIGGIYTGVMLVLGVFVIGAVYQLTQGTLARSTRQTGACDSHQLQ